MTRLEVLAIDLAKLLALETRRDAARFAPARSPLRAPSREEREALFQCVANTPRMLLAPEGRKALDQIRNGWRSKTSVLAALAGVGEALLANVPPDDVPDTPRELDDTATEAP